MQDGVHITRNAMNKMAVKLDQQIKNPKKGVCNANQAKFPSPKKRGNVFARTTTSVLSNKSSYCYICGEGNHVNHLNVTNVTEEATSPSSAAFIHNNGQSEF